MTVVPSVAVLASANFDLVGRAATLPRPGETVLGEGFTTNPGGKGSGDFGLASVAGVIIIIVMLLNLVGRIIAKVFAPKYGR